MEKNRLSVIIVNWNTRELLEKCLNSLYENTSGDILREVILVDNASTDSSVLFVKENFPNIKIIVNTENIGFSAANNKALRIASGEYVLFLNPDVIITKSAIDRLVEFMDKRLDIGLCTPSLIRQDSSRQETYVSFPNLTTELFGRVILKEKKEPSIVQSIRGACMMARRDAINNIGGFNEKYFLFLEETDLCMRLYKSGYKVWYIPNVRVYHTGGGSAGKDKVGARIEYWRSRYIFFRENYSFLKYILLNIGLSIKLGLDWIANLIGIIFTLSLHKKFKGKFKVYSCLILWHVLGKPGDWGLDSGDIIKMDDWLIRKEFLTWWEKNKGLITKKTDNIKLLKENSSRKLMIYNGDVYVKAYKRKPFLKKPWVREWRLINRLRHLDIPTVMPIACGNGYLITKRLDNVKSLHEFILRDFKNINFKEKLVLTQQLAEFLKKLHEKGICHGDLHAGNILAEKEASEYKFYITDLHRAKIKISLSKKDIVDNLVQLDKFFSIEVSLRERMRFFKYYVSGTQFEDNYKEYVRIISNKTISSCHRLWEKRDRLYLRKNKYGIKGKYRDIKYILNPIYKNIDVSNILNCVKPDYGEIIKNSRSSYISRFDIEDIGLVILKIFRQKRFINFLKDFFRKSRGFKAWRGSWALITRGIQTPEPILAGEIRGYGILRSSFIITKDITNSKNLTLFVKDIPEEYKEYILGRLSSYIKNIHNRGIFPLDMKGSNIMVQPETQSSRVISKDRSRTFNFYLIDLDHIKIKRNITLNERFYNIKQIRDSTGLFYLRALSVKRILIVKPSSLGDIVQSFPVATILRRSFPSSNIWWLANRNYVDLLRLMPDIDRTIIFERERWKRWRNSIKTPFEFIKLLKNIRKLNFDIVLDLQGLFRSGLITGFSGAPLKLGFGDAREFASIFYNSRVFTDKTNAQRRYLEIAGYISSIQDIGAGRLNIKDEMRLWAEDVWGDKNKLRITISPGGRWYTKRWDISKYIRLIDELNKKYRARIILIGDRDDMTITSDVTRQTSNVNDLTGRTTLPELATILNGCNILITNDSGPMHLASYLGKPVVAIFGPTDPLKTGPTGENNKIVKASIPCSPCLKRYCENLICMGNISVKDVLSSVEEVLQKR